MNIENQAIDREIALKLKELGVRQESLYYSDIVNYDEIVLYYCYLDLDIYLSQFTLSELLELAPEQIKEKNKNFYLVIKKVKSVYIASYQSELEIVPKDTDLDTKYNIYTLCIAKDKKAANAVGKLLIDMIDKGYWKYKNEKK